MNVDNLEVMNILKEVKILETCSLFAIDFSDLKDKQIKSLLDSFLIKYERTSSKVSNAMLGDMTKGFWNLNKEVGTYVVFTPNEKGSGESFCKDLDPKYNWLVQVLYHKHYQSGSPTKGAEFISEWFRYMNRDVKFIESKSEEEEPLI